MRRKRSSLPGPLGRRLQLHDVSMAESLRRVVDYYLPKDKWTHFLTGETALTFTVIRAGNVITVACGRCAEFAVEQVGTDCEIAISKSGEDGIPGAL